MSICRAAVILVGGVLIASCRERSNPDRKTDPPVEERKSAEPEGDSERAPREEEIAEDCVAFVRSTKLVPTQSSKADCAGCTSAADATEVLAFREFQTDRTSCSDDTCSVYVTLRVAFNPGAAGAISGGLTAWLTPEQRSGYLVGNPPGGQLSVAVKVIYKRSSNSWRAVEFDKAETQ
jgi:hypothetical protein